jgi:hypothetical protein
MPEEPTMTEARNTSLLRSAYRPYVGKTFTATQGSRTYRLTLDAVRPTSAGDPRQRDRCFNLIFSAAAQLPDAFYSLCRPGVPAHQVYLSGDGEPGSMRVRVRQD